MERTRKKKILTKIDHGSLVSYIMKNVDLSKKSINIILSTSHHSPYEVNVHKKDFSYKTKLDSVMSLAWHYTIKGDSIK